MVWAIIVKIETAMTKATKTGMFDDVSNNNSNRAQNLIDDNDSNTYIMSGTDCSCSRKKISD